MLILKRRWSEVIDIEGGIEITVVGIEPGAVKLGIVAPGRTIHRREVTVRMAAEAAEGATGFRAAVAELRAAKIERLEPPAT